VGIGNTSAEIRARSASSGEVVGEYGNGDTQSADGFVRAARTGAVGACDLAVVETLVGGADVRQYRGTVKQNASSPRSATTNGQR
jgi:hypothetical protein